jgi:hypothetical protein
MAVSGLQGAAAGLGGKFIQLRSEDFERRTQAATGQTSGRWAVLFRFQKMEFCERMEAMQQRHPRCRGGEQLSRAFKKLAGEDGLHYVLAEHEVTDIGDTSALGFERFGLNLTTVPAIFVFRDGGMYHWDGLLELDLRTLLDEEISAVVSTFLTDGYKNLPKLEVPPPGDASPVTKLLTYLRNMRRVVAGVLEDKMGDSNPKYLIVCGLAVLVVGNILNRAAKKSLKKAKTTAQKND